jgi:hypothetical protein
MLFRVNSLFKGLITQIIYSREVDRIVFIFFSLQSAILGNSQVCLHCFRLEMQLSLSLFLSLSLSRYMFRQKLAIIRRGTVDYFMAILLKKIEVK